VFCSKCFHATQHDGHDILFSVSPGSGGCCDCGDPEAWKVPLQCDIHTSHDGQSSFYNVPGSEREGLDPELMAALRITVVSVLNFLLDTFALAPEEVTLNASTEDLVRENQEQRTILSRMGIPSQLPTTMDTAMEPVETVTAEEDVDMDKENSDANSKAESSKEDDGELYACIAWNDEAHAFSHVLESIMTATGWSWEKAKQIVDVIHVHVSNFSLDNDKCILIISKKREGRLSLCQPI
jgi:uncharacterized protein (DUF779 family)